MTASADTIARRIAQGRGGERADLVIRDVRLLDLVTGALVETDVAVWGDTVVGTFGAPLSGLGVGPHANPHAVAGSTGKAITEADASGTVSLQPLLRALIRGDDSHSLGNRDVQSTLRWGARFSEPAASVWDQFNLMIDGGGADAIAWGEHTQRENTATRSTGSNSRDSHCAPAVSEAACPA